jgi:hypothetical protein
LRSSALLRVEKCLMANERSCVGCKFLYSWDSGYSNYTVEETEMHCAKSRNANLPASRPWDWNEADDNWPMTNASRCELYAPGERIHLDVDGEDSVAGQSNDAEQVAAVAASSGRP